MFPLVGATLAVARRKSRSNVVGADLRVGPQVQNDSDFGIVPPPRRLVVADCISLVSPQAARLAHFVAPPLPAQPACAGLARGPLILHPKRPLAPEPPQAATKCPWGAAADGTNQTMPAADQPRRTAEHAESLCRGGSQSRPRATARVAPTQTHTLTNPNLSVFSLSSTVQAPHHKRNKLCPFLLLD